MTVWIENTTDDLIFEDYEKTIKEIVDLSLKAEKFMENVEISVTMVDNKEIHRINKEFRNIDAPTDVLSFPLLEFENGVLLKQTAKENINIDTNEVVMGDIIISVERAREQAQEYGHSLKREIAFLTAHSMYHLMGYDHMVEEEEKIMNAKQEAVLEKAGITREVK